MSVRITEEKKERNNNNNSEARDRIWGLKSHFSIVHLIFRIAAIREKMS